MGQDVPTKNQREDAIILADMLLRGTNTIITPERAWLLAATLRWIVKRHGAKVLS